MWKTYISGEEFHGVDPNKCGQVCHCILEIEICTCTPKCIMEIKKCICAPEILGVLGESNKDQIIHGTYHIEQKKPIKNVSFRRENIGFEEIKFHVKEVMFGEQNFLMTND